MSGASLRFLFLLTRFVHPYDPELKLRRAIRRKVRKVEGEMYMEVDCRDSGAGDVGPHEVVMSVGLVDLQAIRIQ